MTQITLYEGCYVKTAGGKVCGPLHEDFDFHFLSTSWFEDGNELFYSEKNDEWSVVAVYPSLAVASAANPEM